MSHFYVYMMTGKNNTVLYTGVTRDLKKRAYEHRNKMVEGFTKRYDLTKLVYYEVLNDPQEAIKREKQIKAGPRTRKINLVNGFNPSWADLYDRIKVVDCHASRGSARNDPFFHLLGGRL